VVCAAGNGGGRGVSFPAAYPGAIAVSALGPDGKLAWYSSFGKRVALTAPGGDVRVDLNKDGIPDGVLQNTIVPGDPSRQGYFPFNGTSMASPHVAGLAALLISEGVTNPSAVASIMKKTAQPMDDADRYGAGLIDADAAVSRALWRAGILRAVLAMLLAVFAIWHTRRKHELGPGAVGPLFALGLIPAACGLFFLRFVEVSIPWIFFVSRPVAEWPGALLGMNWHLNILVGSALMALVPAVLLFGSKRLRPWAAGFAIGMAAYLLAVAIDGSVNVRYLPGYGLLDRAWLFLNALLALFIGRMAVPRR
jgi:serine protease